MSNQVSPRPPTRKQLQTCVANLRRAYPERLSDLDDETIVETMLGPDRRGRPRGCAEKDDPRLYAVALMECFGVTPEDSLREMLGSTSHPDYGRLLGYYDRHRNDMYRKGALALRYDKETGQCSVGPGEPPKLAKLIWDGDAEELPLIDEAWAARQALANK